MRENKIPIEKANKVYDLLVSIGGAPERYRNSFISHHCEDKDGCGEWRFGGKFGYGGKYLSYNNVVTYDCEDETPKLIELASKLNDALKVI